MERQIRDPELERELARRLKQVREQYGADNEQLVRTRDVVLRMARKRRFVRAFEGILVATALILSAFVVPTRFGSEIEPSRVATRVPLDAHEAELPTDPWVVAGVHVPAVVRDGWVPSGTST